MSDAQNSDKNSDKGNKRRRNLEPYKWRKGQSGNPGGRPKRKPITDAYNEILAAVDDKTGMTGAQLLALAAFRKALTEAVPQLIKEITDRVEGPVRQGVDVVFGNMSNDELERWIAEQFAATGGSVDGGETPGAEPGGDSEPSESREG